MSSPILTRPVCPSTNSPRSSKYNSGSKQLISLQITSTARINSLSHAVTLSPHSTCSSSRNTNQRLKKDPTPSNLGSRIVYQSFQLKTRRSEKLLLFKKHYLLFQTRSKSNFLNDIPENFDQTSLFTIVCDEDSFKT